MKNTAQSKDLTLILGGTGKTGRRIAERLAQRSVPTRIASRSASPGFDWDDHTTWDAALKGVSKVYVSFAPDLAIPGATDLIRAFVRKAVQHKVKRLVLLSGRGEEEAQRSERIIQNSGLEWTIVRASWFNQNFSEGAFLEMVLSGEITLPAGDIAEPFVDADDIADVAVAALTEEGHVGEVYEVTGPRLLTFKQVTELIARASSRNVKFLQIPQESFVEGVAHSGAPKEIGWLLEYLFSTVLDGRNAHLTDGVQRALGRQPKDFADYAKEVAESGLWRAAA